MTSEFRLGGDLPINRLGFGAMRLPSQRGMGGKPRDLETGRAVLRRALELGVNHIDTADFYRSGDHLAHANTLIREALHPYPDGLVIATKVGPLIRPDGYSAGAPSDMRALVEENLIGLGMNRLDLVYLRVGHMEPPHGESIAARFEALAELREEGLIRHLGLSNVDTGHLTEARAIAPVTAVQNQYHAVHRADAEMLAACEEAGIAFAPFFPLGGGRELDDDRLAKVAARHRASVAQIGLAWLLASSPVALAIPGTGSVRHLEENMATESVVLSDEDLADLA
ncbi:oxidoreductase [Streptomyces sp. NPDC127044]